MNYKGPRKTDKGSLEALRARITDIEPLFKAPRGESFTVDDIPEEENEVAQTLKFARHKGAIARVGYTYIRRESGSRRKRTKWQWDERIRRELEEYWQEATKLPCGHTAHIYNDPELPEDKLGCKYCADEGKHPAFSKELVKNLI